MSWMRVLILEDEPLIAMDLEDIVENRCHAQCLMASNVDAALRHIADGVDFAMLDIHLGEGGANSLRVASSLMARSIPFCFVSASLTTLPEMFAGVPRVAKPFRPQEIERVLPAAA